MNLENNIEALLELGLINGFGGENCELYMDDNFKVEDIFKKI